MITSHTKKYFEQVKKISDELNKNELEKMVKELDNLRKRRGRIFFLGIGGSAANCSHAVNDFRKINGNIIKEKGKRNHLQDDYVKFLRLAMLQHESSGYGITGLITNHSYLDSPTFRGMRHYIFQNANSAHFIDLNGNSKRNDSVTHVGDENIFDIQQGVGICIMNFNSNTSRQKMFKYASIYGSREFKYKVLEDSSLSKIKFASLKIAPPFYFFIHREDEQNYPEYLQWPKLDEFMTVGGTGIKTNRDSFAIAFDEETLLKRMAKDEDIVNAVVFFTSSLSSYITGQTIFVDGGFSI